MRPSHGDFSADGPINLYNAVILAGSKDAIGKGVLVCLNDQINAARDVTKTNTATADTFRTPELGFLGYMQDNKAHFYRESTKPPHGQERVRHQQPREAAAGRHHLWLCQCQPRAGRCLRCRRRHKGIVNAGVGDGSLADGVKAASARRAQKGRAGGPRSARAGNGIVARNGEVNDDQTDFVVSDTLTAQKARILLMLALTKTSDTKEIQRISTATEALLVQHRCGQEQPRGRRSI